MIAIIREGENTYYTHIYAEIKKGKSIYFLIENEDKTCLKWISNWGKKGRRQVFALDKVPSSWTKKGNMTAEMWVFYCKELRPSLLFPTKKQYPIKDDYALDPKECRLDEWNVISSQQDADTLTNIALGFFDLAIEMVVKKEGKTTVCLGSRGEYGIKIRFEGVERMFGIDEIGIILDADIIYNPGSCGLFINEGVPREGGIPVTENDYFITADKVSYQLILK